MDSYTLQAVTQGYAEIPSGRIHGRVWIRMLRAILEELTMPVSELNSK